MISAYIDVSKVQAYLTRLREMRLERFHKMVEPVLRRSILAHQEKQIGVDGPYRPLAPEYAERKAEEGGGSEILWWTGDLIASIATTADAEAATATFTDPKASFHMGDGPFNQPNYRRDPLFIDDELSAKVQDIAGTFFDTEVGDSE